MPLNNPQSWYAIKHNQTKYAHIHIHTHTHIYIYTHSHTHTHTHTHIYMYTHTHTLLYTHFLVLSAGTVKYNNCVSAEGQDFTNECPRYDTIQPDGEAPVMLEFWRVWCTSLLLLLPGPLWPKVVAPDRVLYMGQIELNCVLMVNWIVWNRTVYLNKNRFGIR